VTTRLHAHSAPRLHQPAFLGLRSFSDIPGNGGDGDGGEGEEFDFPSILGRGPSVPTDPKMAKYQEYAANFVEDMEDYNPDDWPEVDELFAEEREDETLFNEEYEEEGFDYSHENELKPPRQLKAEHARQLMVEDRIPDDEKFTPEAAQELLDSYNAELDNMDNGEGKAMTLEELYQVKVLVQHKAETGKLEDILDANELQAWAEACKAAGVEVPFEEATPSTITVDDLSPGGVSVEERELQKKAVLAEARKAKLRKERATSQWGEVNLMDLELERDLTMECLDDLEDEFDDDYNGGGDREESSGLPQDREMPEEPPVPLSLRAYMEVDDDNLQEGEDRDLQLSHEERDEQTSEIIDYAMQQHTTDGRLDYFYNSDVMGEEPMISDQAYDALRTDGRFVDEKGKDALLGLVDNTGDDYDDNRGDLYSNKGGVIDVGGTPITKGKGKGQHSGTKKNPDDLQVLDAAPTSYSYFVWNEDIKNTVDNPPAERRKIEDATGLGLEVMGETHSAPMGGDPHYEDNRVTIFDILPDEVSPASVALKTVEYMGGMKMPGDDDVKYGEQKVALFVDLDGVDVSEERKTFIRELCHNRLINNGKTLKLNVDKYRFCGQNVKHSVRLLSQILEESEKAANDSGSRTDPSTTGTKNLPRPGYNHGTSQSRKVRV